MDKLGVMAEGLAAQRRSVGDDDAVQDGFLRIVQHGDLPGLANPLGYWYSAARNARRDRQRARVGRTASDTSVARGPTPPPATRSVGRDGQLDDLRRAVEGLEGRRRRLIDLELEGRRDLRELAATLGISEGAARVLRHRTYRQLKAVLPSESESEECADSA